VILASCLGSGEQSGSIFFLATRPVLMIWRGVGVLQVVRQVWVDQVGLDEWVVA